jgi:phosphomannomutase
MVFRLAELFGVEAYETHVGFKHVAPLMMSKDAIIGGEESGGYGFQNHAPERDGILASLYFLDLVVKTGKTPSQLIAYLYSKVGPHHYDRLDLDFPQERRPQVVATLATSAPKDIMGKQVVNIDRSEGLRLLFSDGSWLFLRLSGTEPIMRIYAESPSLAESTALVSAGRELVGI